MSIRVMDLVWRNFPGGGSDLLAMLALADWCNDDGGSLHPSIAAVARRIRKSESQARRSVRKLMTNDWVIVVGNQFGGAPGTTRQYRLNVEKLNQTPSVYATPRVSETPRTDARDGSHGCETTAGMDATLTVKKQPSGTVKKKSARIEIDLPAWLPADAWANWDTQRKAMNAKGWTPMAMKKSIDTLTRLHEGGHDVVAVISNAIEKGWTGLYAPRQETVKQQTAGSRHGGFDQRSYGEGGPL